jgi:rhamnosyltransferase
MGNIGKTMIDRSVCAVIVTYHPTATMIENLSKVFAQVQGMVAVDNGSEAEELNRLRAASQMLGFHLIENRENLGIAEALNRGVLWAKNQGFPWIILFDQDSKITDGFMEKMFATWQTHPSRERVGAIHPSYVNPVSGIEPFVFRASDGGPVTSMTSGSLMPTWIFDKIGYFSSEYFIDLVDTDYGLRIRQAGYLNVDSREAKLIHFTGNPKKFTFLGFTCEPTNHSPVRRYYFSRNRIVVFKKYFRLFPRYIFHIMYTSLRETVKCFLTEQDRGHKFRNLLLGTWDGLIGRMGKREGI